MNDCYYRLETGHLVFFLQLLENCLQDLGVGGVVVFQLVEPSIQLLNLLVLLHVVSLHLVDVLPQLVVLALHQLLLGADVRLQLGLLLFDDLEWAVENSFRIR